MTRPAPQIIPLPAAQMALHRARHTIRDDRATDAEVLAACATLQREGDWMDHDTAARLRLAVLERNGWHDPRARRRAPWPARKTVLAAVALALAALLAGAILAEWQITENIAATVAQAQEAYQ